MFYYNEAKLNIKCNNKANKRGWKGTNEKGRIIGKHS